MTGPHRRNNVIEQFITLKNLWNRILEVALEGNLFLILRELITIKLNKFDLFWEY